MVLTSSVFDVYVIILARWAGLDHAHACAYLVELVSDRAMRKRKVAALRASCSLGGLQFV